MVIVASVSCIYSLGEPEEYNQNVVRVKKGEMHPRNRVLRMLNEIQYERNDTEFGRGTFRVRGECLEVWPAYGPCELHLADNLFLDAQGGFEEYPLDDGTQAFGSVGFNWGAPLPSQYFCNDGASSPYNPANWPAAAGAYPSGSPPR